MGLARRLGDQCRARLECGNGVERGFVLGLLARLDRNRRHDGDARRRRLLRFAIIERFPKGGERKVKTGFIRQFPLDAGAVLLLGAVRYADRLRAGGAREWP